MMCVCYRSSVQLRETRFFMTCQLSTQTSQYKQFNLAILDNDDSREECLAAPQELILRASEYNINKTSLYYIQRP